MMTISGRAVMKCFEQKIAAAVQEMLRRPDCQIRSARPEKPALPASTAGSATDLTSGPGKPGTCDPPVTTVTSKLSVGKRRGDAAGTGEMADAKKMLDVEEDARCAHAFCHSLSKRRVELADAGIVVEVFTHACSRQLARAVAQIRLANGVFKCNGQQPRVFRRDDKAVFAAGQQFGNSGNIGRDADEVLARGLNQHIGQAVTIAICRDAAGKGKQIGTAVMLKHLFLGKRAFPGDAVGNAELFRQRLELCQLVAAANMDEPPVKIGWQEAQERARSMS